jgi:hypothetical protein
MYNAQQQAGQGASYSGGSGQQGQGGNNQEGDVTDVDFEEVK